MLTLALSVGMSPSSFAWAQEGRDADSPPPDFLAGYVPYSARAHNTIIAIWRVMPDTATHALRQLYLWLGESTVAQEQNRIISDLVTVAWRSGHPALAVEAAKKFPVEAFSDYALGPLAYAARAVGDNDLQKTAVTRWLVVAPNDRDARIAQVRWQIDTGALELAETSIETMEKSLSSNRGGNGAVMARDVFELRGAVADARNDAVGAMRESERLFELDPADAGAQRTFIQRLDAAGSPTEAWRRAVSLAAVYPDLLSPLDTATLRQRALGQRVGWAVTALGSERELIGPNRLSTLEALVRELDQARSDTARDAAASPEPENWKPIRSRLQADSVVALQAAGRPEDALALVTQASDQGLVLPGYGLIAAAVAWQQLKRSDLAVPLYEKVIAAGGPDMAMPSAAHTGLLNAYLDTARFPEAQSLMDKLEAATPPTMRIAPKADTPNADFLDMRVLKASMLLYTDQPSKAQEELEALASETPTNSSVQIAVARTERLRGQPRLAAERLRNVIADDPYAADARIAYAEVSTDLGDYATARTLTRVLRADYPDSISVRNLERNADVATGPRLEINAMAGEGGQVLSSRDRRVDTRLSSALFDDHWRIFYDQNFGDARLDAGSTRRVRSGIGLQSLQGAWELEAVLHRSNGVAARTGMAGAVSYRASDAWRFTARADSNTLDVPWRAWQAGVSAREASFNARYEPNESRRLEAQSGVVDFRDGNNRRAQSAAWTERWVSGPRVQVETIVAAASSRARTSAVPYFSPVSDRAVEATARLLWLTWKRDNRTFQQVFEGGPGRYKQAGFASDSVWQVRYAHRWTMGTGTRIEYGVGVTRHPYDGVRETRRQIFLTATFPLP